MSDRERSSAAAPDRAPALYGWAMRRLAPLQGGEGFVLFLLYFLLAAGGLWHLLGWFQELMRLLAAPMLIAVALLVSYAHGHHYELWRGPAGARLRWLGFLAGVLLSAFWLEWAGVTTGKIFGRYAYGEKLQPQLFGVPLAIGFAWLSMVLSSAAVADRLIGAWTRRAQVRRGLEPPSVKVTPASDRALLRILLTALLMLFFDWVMEPAAVRLGYWSWQEGIIPLQNYLAWFLFSFLYAAAAWRLGFLQRGAPRLSRHAWLAQIIYFLMVRLG
ncbi:MAG TPA: carotenoid biosynthesis protein [bacterium]|nr:carotenoid biosynthesis protein [bacterium]